MRRLDAAVLKRKMHQKQQHIVFAATSVISIVLPGSDRKASAMFAKTAGNNSRNLMNSAEEEGRGKPQEEEAGGR
jgi:hypothetical protein